jgi:hypothetical protein
MTEQYLNRESPDHRRAGNPCDAAGCTKDSDDGDRRVTLLER